MVLGIAIVQTVRDEVHCCLSSSSITTSSSKTQSSWSSSLLWSTKAAFIVPASSNSSNRLRHISCFSPSRAENTLSTISSLPSSSSSSSSSRGSRPLRSSPAFVSSTTIIIINIPPPNVRNLLGLQCFLSLCSFNFCSVPNTCSQSSSVQKIDG